MSGRVLIVNPNANGAVTAAMAEAVAPLVVTGGPALDCVTLEEGPFGIESQADVEAVTLPLARLVRAREDADAFVIACFSDPGLAVCREATARPVLGIQECAVMTALTVGDRYGVVALSEASIRRQDRYARQMGVAERRAGARPLGLSVAAAEAAAARPRIEAVARRLVEEDGADVVILGCAGMARHRAPLARALGRPVIDPVQAAAVQAMGLVLLARGSAA